MSTYQEIMEKQEQEEAEVQKQREAMGTCPQCGGRLGGVLFGNACIGKLLPYPVPGRGRFGKSCGYKLSTK